MALFGGKDKGGKVNLPVPQVKALGERGYSEADIKEVLKKKGYTDSEIDQTLQKALSEKVGEKPPKSQTDLSQHSEPRRETRQPQNRSPPSQGDQNVPDDLKPSVGNMGGMPRMSGEDRIEGSEPRESHPSMPQQSSPEESSMTNSDHVEVDLEPIVEAIVEEKWDDMAAFVNNLDEKMSSLQDSVKQLKTGEEQNSEAEYLRNQLEERIDGIEEQVEMMDAKLSSIEKAFKQFIPNLTGNIKALSSAVKQIKLSESLENEEE